MRQPIKDEFGWEEVHTLRFGKPDEERVFISRIYYEGRIISLSDLIRILVTASQQSELRKDQIVKAISDDIIRTLESQFEEEMERVAARQPRCMRWYMRMSPELTKYCEQAQAHGYA